MTVISSEPTKRDRILFRIRVQGNSLCDQLAAARTKEEKTELRERAVRLFRTQTQIKECKQ